MAPKPHTRSDARLRQAFIDEGPISPPPTALPRTTMKPYAGTKIDEVAALRLLLPDKVSNPYQALAPVFRDFAPRGIFNEAQYVSLLPLLYNEAMSDLDTYVSIQDLLNAAFCASSVNTNLEHR